LRSGAYEYAHNKKKSRLRMTAFEPDLIATPAGLTCCERNDILLCGADHFWKGASTHLDLLGVAS
jgi:hypothetical protein